MDASAGENNQGSMRERELEVEIARLNAEIAVLKGDSEPAEVAARFLTMAASTVDQAMADARREAEELVVEVASAAEARRDEATRVAEQVEAETEALRVEANNQQAAAEAARHEAQRVTDAATDHINKERARVAEEVERLADVRTALESERSALETYHEELKRRVQELAESMVSFMTTEPPLAAVTAIDELAKPAIEPAAAAVEAAYAPAPVVEERPVDAMVEPVPMVEAESMVETVPMVDAAEIAEVDVEPTPEPIVPMNESLPESSAPMAEATAPVVEPVAETPAPVVEPAPTPMPEPEATAPVVEPVAEMPAPVVEPAPMSMAEPTPFAESAPADPVFASELADVLGDDTPPATPIADAPSSISAEPPAVEPAEMMADENEALFGRATATPAAAPAAGREVFDTPAPAPTPSFADMMSGGRTEPAPAEFGGVPVVDAAEEVPARRKMGGLFSRSRNAEAAPVEPVLPEAPAIEGGLFGSQASRLIEQTSPEQLASALADDSEEDERFRSFLDGDGGNDPSRDWLLRPEQDD